MKDGEVMVYICTNAGPVNGGTLGMLRYQVLVSPSFVKRYNVSSLHQLAKLPCLVFDEYDKLQHQFLAEISDYTPKNTHICPSSEGLSKQ